MKKLLIVGNGFDIGHGLSTRYWDFRRYLEENHLDFLLEFEKMYGFYPIDFNDPFLGAGAEKKRNDDLHNMLWKDFETALGKPEVGDMLNRSQSTIDDLGLESGNIGIEDTMNAYWKEQYGFVRKFERYVKEWIEQVSIENVVPKKSELVDNDEYICLSFNYTNTLETVYHIKDVFHIHGSVSSIMGDEPIMGHCNWSDIQKHRDAYYEARNNLDEGEASIQRAIADFLECIYKDTDEIIKRNEEFFEGLHEINSVTIIGWSAGVADQPYLEKIVKSINNEATWYVYWHDAEAKNTLTGVFDRMKIDPKYRKLKNDKEFWD